MDLNRKIDFAINLLRSIPQDGPIGLSYSGGKDSDVILELAKMSGIPFDAIYKNTTIDPPGTIAHCIEKGVRIIKPKMTFLQIVQKSSMPSRWSRFCCEILKEYKTHDRAILGIRRCESSKRAKRYKEPEECRVFSKTEKVRQYYPILEWTNEDVAQFIKERGIKCAPVYYDENGQFHVERRLGCLGCPLRSDNGVGEYLKYPKLLRQVIKSVQIYLDAHPQTKAFKMYDGDACNLVFSRLFCGNSEKYKTLSTGGLLPDSAIDARKYLSDFFGIEL